MTTIDFMVFGATGGSAGLIIYAARRTVLRDKLVQIAPLVFCAVIGAFAGALFFRSHLGPLQALEPPGSGPTSVAAGIGAMALAAGYLVGGGSTETASTPRDALTAPLQLLFHDPRSAPIWLLARLYVGLQWLEAGWMKVTSPAWMDGGSALESFWLGATQVPEGGRPVVNHTWYRAFLKFMLDHGWHSWFAKLIAITELTIGLLLIVGLITGVAALLGASLNFNFMLAGDLANNPVMFGLSILLILAWRVAGRWGADRWALPRLTGWIARLRATSQFDGSHDRH